MNPESKGPKPESGGTDGTDGTDGTNGTVGTNGTTGTKKMRFDPSKLDALTGSAKVGSNETARRKILSFEKHDPNDPPDKGMNFRTNEYDRALLRYVAGLRGESVQQTLRSIFRERALELAKT